MDGFVLVLVLAALPAAGNVLGGLAAELVEVSEPVLSLALLTPDPRDRDGAPAQRWQVRRRTAPGVAGTVGIIASVTELFCADCRRTRIPAEGKVMSCLFSRRETDLRDLLRSGADDEAIAGRWQEAMWTKPAAHGMDHTGLDSPDYVLPDRSMSAIGG